MVCGAMPAEKLCALRMVFGQIHTVMPHTRGMHHFGIGFGVVTQQDLCGGPDTGEVGGVVGGVCSLHVST